MTSKTSAVTKPTSAALDLEDEIRRRAHELYEQRGREDGHDVEDWLRAEEEIKEMRALSAAKRATHRSVIGHAGRLRPMNGSAFAAST